MTRNAIRQRLNASILLANLGAYGSRWLWSHAQASWRRIHGLNLSQIGGTVFISDQFRPEQWPAIHALGVRAVLNMQAEQSDRFAGPLPARTLNIRVPDFEAPSIVQLHEAVAFIQAAHEQRLPVLVHCYAGVGRAPLTVAAYLIGQGQTANQAIATIRRSHPLIALNQPQIQRLREWEQLHHEGQKRV